MAPIQGALPRYAAATWRQKLSSAGNACNIANMNLNIRDFPEELAKSLKKEAVDRDMTLREVVIERCSGKLDNPNIATTSLDSGISPKKSTTPSTVTRKKPAKTVSAESVGLPTESSEQPEFVSQLEKNIEIPKFGGITVADAEPKRQAAQGHAVGCPCTMCKIKRGDIK